MSIWRRFVCFSCSCGCDSVCACVSCSCGCDSVCVTVYVTVGVVLWFQRHRQGCSMPLQPRPCLWTKPPPLISCACVSVCVCVCVWNQPHKISCACVGVWTSLCLCYPDLLTPGLLFPVLRDTGRVVTCLCCPDNASENAHTHTHAQQHERV